MGESAAVSRVTATLMMASNSSPDSKRMTENVTNMVRRVDSSRLHGPNERPPSDSIGMIQIMSSFAHRDPWRIKLCLLCVPMFFSLAGCPRGSGHGEPVVEWYRPDVSATWQWQLQPNANGQINISYAVDVYDIDLFDAPQSVIDALHADGRRVICYFSAGSFEDFRVDVGEFLPEDLGNTLDGFPEERWLDIRSDQVRRIMRDRLDLAREKRCDAVEPDNVTGFTNDTGFDLTAADQLDFNRFLADEAHARGLGVGLKNDLEQIPGLVDAFDFAVNEQCHYFDECDVYAPFIAAGKPVFSAEYAEEFVNNPAARNAMCERSRELGLQTLVLPLDLDDSLRFTCEP